MCRRCSKSARITGWPTPSRRRRCSKHVRVNEGQGGATRVAAFNIAQRTQRRDFERSRIGDGSASGTRRRLTTNPRTAHMATQPETPRGASPDAIRHHYDVGNDFYRLWLDDSLTYSCALWNEGDSDRALEAAQLRKYDYHVNAAQAANAG